MWYCQSCGTQNGENSRFCVECGKPRPAENASAQQPAQNWQPAGGADYAQPAAPAWGAPPPQPAKKKSPWWLWLILGLAVLAVAAVVCYFTVHIWNPATCTEPETCKICGDTRGMPLGHSTRAATCTEPEICNRCGLTVSPALGHDADPATCDEPSVCDRCGLTLSPALGHDWLPATYDEPETCSRCGETRGELKGFIGDLEGVMSDENLFLYGYNQSHAYVLDTPVHNCLRLTLGLKLTAVSGNPYGKWAIYGRDLSGNWKQLDTFYVYDSALNNWVTFDFEWDGSRSFSALSILPVVDTDYSISYSFYYENAQEYQG